MDIINVDQDPLEVEVRVTQLLAPELRNWDSSMSIAKRRYYCDYNTTKLHILYSLCN